jgi:CheY-like chemotaxis protein
MTVQSGVIMVVDSDAAECELAGHLLQRAGHVPIMAYGGAQALARLKGCRVDLLLVAVTLRDMSGQQLLDKLRADEELPTLPVMMTAAQGEVGLAVQCLQLGAQDYLLKPFTPALFVARLNTWLEKKRLRDQEQAVLRQLIAEKKRVEDLLDLIIPLGVAFSAEKDFNRLLERILLEAKQICRADGGTLYLREGDELRFEIMRTDTLHIALGGSTGQPIPFAPLRLHDPAGAPNHHNIATHAALTAASVNIADAYAAEGFDFSGTRAFDQANGYRSRSFMTIPLKNAAGAVIGVLQLINARNANGDEVIAFDPVLQRIVEALSALAAVALEAYIREQQLQREIEELRIEIDEPRRWPRSPRPNISGGSKSAPGPCGAKPPHELARPPRSGVRRL